MRTFPETQVIVNHLGGLFGIGPTRAGTSSASPPGIPMCGAGAVPECSDEARRPRHADVRAAEFLRRRSARLTAIGGGLAALYRSCIEAFGADRCLFESNYPVDSATARYPVIWNAFKRIASGASTDEAALFGGTAARLYRIDLQELVRVFHVAATQME